MKRKVTIVILVTVCFAIIGIQGYKLYKDTEVRNENSNKKIIYSDQGERRLALSPEKLPEAAKVRGNSLTVGVNNIKGNFNPIYSNSLEDTWVCNLIFEGLIGYDINGEPVGKLAQSWSISEDGMTYSFKLRDNIKFSDGTKLTTEDVRYTYSALCDKSYLGVYENTFKLLQGYEEYKLGNSSEVSGIQVISPNEIRFIFKEADASLINDFNIGILSRQYYYFNKGDIKAIDEKNLKPMGTGPYILSLFKSGEELDLKKNKGYWSNIPTIENIIMKVCNNKSVVQSLADGEIDIGRVAAMPDNISKLRASGFLDTYLYEDNSFQYIGLNLRNNKFKDMKVRQALIYGLNRQAFVNNYYGEYGWTCNVPFIKSSWAFPKVILQEYSYDKEKANKLLQDSGWTLRGDGFRYDEFGERFTIKWLTYENNLYVQKLVSRVKADWKAIGIEVVEEVVPFDKLVEQVFESQDFEMYNMAWKLGVDPDPSPMFSLNQDVPGGYNAVGFRCIQGEKLIKAALKEYDKDKRKKIYEAWSRLVNEELPYIFINGNKEVYGVSSKIKNLELSPYMDWTDNISKVHISY